MVSRWCWGARSRPPFAGVVRARNLSTGLARWVRMSGTVGRRVWRALTAALAALLLLLAPAGHAQAETAQGKASAQAAVAHEAVVVAPTTRAPAGRTGSLSTDATVTPTESPAGATGSDRTAPRLDLVDRTADDTASARAPPLRD